MESRRDIVLYRNFGKNSISGEGQGHRSPLGLERLRKFRFGKLKWAMTERVVDSVDVTWLELMVDDSSFFWMTVTSSWFSFPPSNVFET